MVACYGVTQNPDTKDYMMVLSYYEDGNLRNYLNKSEDYIGYKSKIYSLLEVVRGLLDIHNSEKVHKDFHSGNILFSKYCSSNISNLGMCQPIVMKKNQSKKRSLWSITLHGARSVMWTSIYKSSRYLLIWNNDE